MSGMVSGRYTLHSVGRDIEDHWEKTLPDDAAAWSEAIPRVKKRVYTHDDCVAEVEADFRPLVRRFRRDFQQMEIIYGRASKERKLQAVQLLMTPVRMPTP